MSDLNLRRASSLASREKKTYFDADFYLKFKKFACIILESNNELQDECLAVELDLGKFIARLFRDQIFQAKTESFFKLHINKMTKEKKEALLKSEVKREIAERRLSAEIEASLAAVKGKTQTKRNRINELSF